MSKRRAQERHLAQYELVGFLAGLVRNTVDTILDLLSRREARYGSDAYLERIKLLLNEANAQIRDWQMADQLRQNYPEQYQRRA